MSRMNHHTGTKRGRGFIPFFPCPKHKGCRMGVLLSWSAVSKKRSGLANELQDSRRQIVRSGLMSLHLIHSPKGQKAGTEMATKKVTRRAIPYQQIATLVQQNMSAVDIAKKLNRVTKGADPGHSIRAIISRMRSVGYKVNDKTVKLRVQRVGQVRTKTAKAGK